MLSYKKLISKANVEKKTTLAFFIIYIFLFHIELDMLFPRGGHVPP
jgi:hypothetical protein